MLNRGLLLSMRSGCALIGIAVVAACGTVQSPQASPVYVKYAGTGIEHSINIPEGSDSSFARVNVDLVNVIDPVSGSVAPRGERAVAFELGFTYKGMSTFTVGADASITLNAGFGASLMDSDGIQYLPASTQPSVTYHGVGPFVTASTLHKGNILPLNVMKRGLIIFYVPSNAVIVSLTYQPANMTSPPLTWNFG
ncbi:MAG: hypothetical protein ACP5OR_00900 [Candidatus Dormibacteria bacterium]